MIEIIQDKKKWDALIDSFEESDFYHTYDYHQLSRNVHDYSVLIKYSGQRITIALPLLIRSIEDSKLKDATSVYGYAGPLSTSVPSSADQAQFRRELLEYFKSKSMVSVFSRLNPFIPRQELILQGLGEIVSPGNVVNIDLRLDLERQKHQYHRRLRTYINKCRREYSIKNGVTREEVEQFISLYRKNMHRVNAKTKYYFDNNYFFGLMVSRSFDTELLLALSNDNKQVVAGAMFIKRNRIVQYHLSGVDEDYLKLNPVKLLIDEMRLRAAAQNYWYFNLGGAAGNKVDSLFDFKRSFSHDIHAFNLWRFVVDQKKYNQLVEQKGKLYCSLKNVPCLDFFPCYRCDAPSPTEFQISGNAK